MMKKIFNLYNRYNEKVFLEQITGNKFKLVYPKDSLLRVIYSEDNKTIMAVDPSGGPFLCINYIVEDNLKVSKIEQQNSDFIIILKTYDTYKTILGDSGTKE